jgi:hypothetical protein
MAAGGTVRYDFQRDAWRSPNPSPPAPRWLVKLLGVDFFADVTSVTFRTPQTDAILAYVGRLHRLRYMDAQPPIRVTDAGLAHLAGLSELRGLEFQGTQGLTDAGLAHLAALGRLEGLHIYGPTGIEGPGLAHLAGLRRLKSLSIHANTDAYLPSLSRLTGLRELNIGMAEGTDPGLPSLSRLTGLQKLFLSMPEVTDAALARLSRLTWLEELAFGGETGGDAGMAHLRALTNLKILQVYGPWFTDSGLASVSEMDRLPTFFVSDTTGVTGGGLTRLQRQRPALRIGVNGYWRTDRARTELLRRSVYQALAQMYEDRVIKRLWMIEDLTELSKCNPTYRESSFAQDVNEERRAIEYLGWLKRKYERAASNTWIGVPADPPEPEWIWRTEGPH